jgi:hypothetical protein
MPLDQLESAGAIHLPWAEMAAGDKACSEALRRGGAHVSDGLRVAIEPMLSRDPPVPWDMRLRALDQAALASVLFVPRTSI